MTIQLGNYVIFVLLGYLLSTQDLTKKQKIALYISAIVGVLFRYIITFILSKQSGVVVKNTWGYSQWHSILLACAVFVIIKDLRINEKIKKNKKVANILKEVSSCSFGIYLIHRIIMYYQISLLDIKVSTIKWRTLGIISTYIISLVIVYILKKIPVLKRLVP